MDSIQGYTIKEASKELGISDLTVRRYIKQGRLVARKVNGKFGEQYIIESLPHDLLDKAEILEKTVNYSQLIARLEQLNQEVGFWRGKAEELQNRVLLLSPPASPPASQTNPPASFWKRLFRIKG